MATATRQDAGVSEVDQLRLENELLRQTNAQLRSALQEITAAGSEPEQILRAIREDEVEALVVQHGDEEKLYSLQPFDSLYRIVVEECFPYGVWLAEEDGTLVYVTDSFLELLGTTLADLQSKGQFHFLPAEARQPIEREWAACREAGRSCNVEYTLRDADGNTHTIWTHGLLTTTYDGRSRWFGVNIDITKQKELYEQLQRSEEMLRKQAEELQQADRRKDEFLALLGHELRNPLAPLRNGLHILRLPGVSEPTAKQVIAMMEKQIRHLSRLIDDLLNISRITRGKILLHKERVGVGEAIAQAVSSVHPQIKACNHTLNVSLPDEALFVLADHVRLEQILVNLLNNAAKYTPSGGAIGLSARSSGGDLVICVSDNGIGITEDLLPKIFDLFTQAESSLERSQGGLGIGLTLVEKLVELHGGTISAHSAGHGKGSEFVIRLPLLVDEHAAQPSGDPEPPAAAERRMKMLVVEDSADSAECLAILLELGGHEVCAVHDGPSALEKFCTFCPDVVLLDIGLPGMSGYEVARHIREVQGDASPLIIAVSGYGHPEDKRRAEEAGCDYHLTKPVDPGQLKALFRSSASS